MSKVSLLATIALGGLVAFSTLATAQDATPKKEAASGKKAGMAIPTVEERLGKLSEILSLTDEQKPKVKAVLEESDKKFKEAAGDRQKIMNARIDEADRMKPVLKDDQYKKYELVMYRGKKPAKTAE